VLTVATGTKGPDWYNWPSTSSSFLQARTTVSLVAHLRFRQGVDVV
jgi:hypothetical protein